jgi:hypothetical protein
MICRIIIIIIIIIISVNPHPLLRQPDIKEYRRMTNRKLGDRRELRRQNSGRFILLEKEIPSAKPPNTRPSELQTRPEHNAEQQVLCI